MVALTKAEKLRKEEQSQYFKPLIDSLIQCSAEEFNSKLKNIQEWNRSRDDLYVWIPVLNRIDDILSDIVKKYHYNTKDWKKLASKLLLMSKEDENAVWEYLDFSARLLNNTSNRSIYNSLDVMCSLLNSPNFKVKLGASKIIALIGERNVISRQKMDSKSIMGSEELKEKSLQLALCLPSSTADDKMEHIALVDLYFEKKKYPKKYACLDFKYYSKTHKKPCKDGLKSPCKVVSTPNKMNSFALSTESIKSLTLQQIFDKGMQEVPKEDWFRFSLQATIAKAFSDDSFENIQLRNLIIRTKFTAIAIVNVIQNPAQVSSQFFEVDPYAFNSLAEFLSLSESRIPHEIRMEALFALECISLKHIWCSDIVRNLGGNMSHGQLFHILKFISKGMRGESEQELDEKYNVRFFYLISNLADVKVLQESLLNAGLIPAILDIVSVRSSKHKRTNTSATHLLEVLLDSDSINDLISNNGLNTLIETLKEEVQFAIDHPDFGQPPEYGKVYYSISFKQISYIRSLLKLVLKLLSLDSGNRMRNLIDSPILTAINQILENKSIFGLSLLSHVLDVIQTAINTEPTIYQVLVESGTIPYIVNNFEEFVAPSYDLLRILPEVISAVCLNMDGLKQVKEKQLIRHIFKIPLTLEFAKIMSAEDECIDLGSSLDELSRHYPDLREEIMEHLIETIKELPKVTNFTHSYIYKSQKANGLFYSSIEEEVLDEEEGKEEMASWEIQKYAPVLETFSGIFFGLMENASWASKIAENIDARSIFETIILQRPTYDYIDSQAFLNFTDALKTFDEEVSGFGFPTLMEILSQNLDCLGDFLHFDRTGSYFLYDSNAENLEEIIRRINVLQVTLSTITSVHTDAIFLYPATVKETIRYFEKNGLSLLSKIQHLFERCALEEFYIREKLPDKVSVQTRPNILPGTPPLLIQKQKVDENEVKSEKTSAKFKNTLQARFLMSSIQSCCAVLFRSFLSLAGSHRMSFSSSDRIMEVRIYDEITQSLSRMLEVPFLKDRVGYMAVLQNFIAFTLSYSTISNRSLDYIKVIPLLLFYQCGGLQKYKECAMLLIEKCLEFDDVKAIESIDYLKDQEDVLTSNALVAILSFFNKAMQFNSLELLSSKDEYYPHDELDYNLPKGLLTSIKILGLGLLKDVFSLEAIFVADNRKLPYPVFKQLLGMLKNIYHSSEEVSHEDFELYELRWDLLPPSTCKVEMLKDCGIEKEAAYQYLKEHKDDLPIHVKPEIFTDAQWEAFKAAKKTGKWQTDLRFIPAFYENMRTKKDLCDFRASFYRGGFEKKILCILRHYPKLINAVSKMFMEIYSELEFPHISMLEDLLALMNSTPLEESDNLAPVIHLFGIFLNEEKIYNQAKTVIHKFVTFLVRNLAPQHVNCSWFFKALYVYEIIFARSMIPDFSIIPEDFDVPTIPTVEVQRLSLKDKNMIFDVLIRVTEITDFYSSLAVSRILILYSSEEDYASEIVQAGIIPKLLKVIGMHQKSEKINYLESSLLLLCRRCFENTEVATSLIKYELNKAFTIEEKKGLLKEKARDLSLLLSQKAGVLMRNPGVFEAEISKTGRFIDFSSSHKLERLTMKRFPTELDDAMKGVENAKDESRRQRSHIIDLLLSQLMAASKKDWLSEPPLTKEEESKQKKSRSTEIKPSRNPICAYMIFLLKTLIELIGSYKQSKFEFLTYNKRGKYSESPAPRMTALNFFLHQLMNCHAPEKDAYEVKRREFIAKLASCAVTSLVTTVQDEKIGEQDPKVTDPNMTFIRKFTLDSISKALQDASSSQKLIESNFGKILGWFRLINALLITDRRNLLYTFDDKKLHADKYEICKLMLDMGLPGTISGCLGNLDLNIPHSKKLFNTAVDPLNAFNKVRNQFSELFKEENLEEDEEVEEESEKEDVPDMFRNSALGMYEIEDIEDEDDDDSLIGDDDEDIAFVQGHDDIEIVFSDDGVDYDGAPHELHGSSESEGESDDDASSILGDGNEGEMLSDSDISSSGTEGSIATSAEVSGDLEFYSDDESAVELVQLSSGDNDDYASSLDIDLNESDISSDWESGLSELDDSEIDDDSEDQEELRRIHNNVSNNRWFTSDGVEIYDDSDGEDRGVFRGIQHVNNDEFIFRIENGGSSRGGRRSRPHPHHHHENREPSIISLGNTVDRAGNRLTNPLGPHGMEEVEDIISNGQNNERSSRRYGSGIIGGWLSDALMDNKSYEGIVFKNTIDRWSDIFEMFYEGKGFIGNALTTIVSNVVGRSSLIWEEKKRGLDAKEKEKQESLQRIRKRSHLEMEMDADQLNHRNAADIPVSPGVPDTSGVADASAIATTPDVQLANENRDDQGEAHEPIYVTVDGNDIDIGGTDIDPEFINALPEEMRAEVLAQHITERRMEALEHNIDSREIDDEFLDSVPASLRQNIIEGEATARRFSNVSSERMINEIPAGEDSELDDESEGELESHSTDTKGRVYYEPLVDRSGIAAIMRSLFISQPYLTREIYHDLFFKLSHSKQNRSDIVNFLLLILTEGIQDQHSLEKVFNLISNKAKSAPNNKNFHYQLPTDCTPLIVANQCIEVLQSMIESDVRLKYFFITEHDNLIINKPGVKNKKDIFSKNLKWPINALFSLLSQKIVTDETVLMDLLTNIIRHCTKAMRNVSKRKDNTAMKRSFQLPLIEKKHLELLVSVIQLDSCNTKVFQQTLNIMTNIFSIKDAKETFTTELKSLANSTVSQLIKDLNELSIEIPKVKSGTEINPEIIGKFTASSSEQAKLLRIVTALDYIYSHKKKDVTQFDELVFIFNGMNLGPVWVSLSKCLSAFEEKAATSSSATILLPTIESLMVVCKNSKVRETGAVLLKYTEKNYNFEVIPVEDLFFEFTDLHKKLLNEMIRTNPQLMSGPFQLLVKNPKILDFDNKRYYFMAKISVTPSVRKKLSISVRRDQVFLDSYRSLFFKPNDEIKNCKLDISFKGESGVDEGGVTREWYQVLSRQMFNPDYALFIPVASDKTTFRPNRTSGINPEHLSFFKFVGMIIAKAITDKCFLDCHFSREVYKNILGKTVSLKDMESLDLEYYKSLIWILENDITYVIEETFSVDTDDYGEHKTIDLIENGHNIAVTEENKKEYVQKVVEYKLQDSVKDQMENFLQGFYAIIPMDLISIFDEQEIELLISGLPDIDVDDWKNNTTYVNYTSTCKQINYFWRAVRSFDKEERAKLLQFVTGTSKVPLNGFKELTGIHGVSKFSIHRDYGSTERLPSSHTCFNQLDLPAYDSYEQLRGSLLLAINEGHEGFGLA